MMGDMYFFYSFSLLFDVDDGYTRGTNARLFWLACFMINVCMYTRVFRFATQPVGVGGGKENWNRTARQMAKALTRKGGHRETGGGV